MRDEGDLPFACRFLLDGSGLDRSFQTTMQFDRNHSYFRNADAVLAQRHALWDAKGMGSGAFLLLFGKPKVFGIVEEVLEGLVEIAQNLLECLTVGFLEVGIFLLLFEEGEFFALSLERESFACLLIMLDPACECPVPDHSPTAGKLTESRFLFGSGRDPVLVAFLDDHSHLYQTSVLFVKRERHPLEVAGGSASHP